MEEAAGDVSVGPDRLGGVDGGALEVEHDSLRRPAREEERELGEGPSVGRLALVGEEEEDSRDGFPGQPRRRLQATAVYRVELLEQRRSRLQTESNSNSKSNSQKVMQCRFKLRIIFFCLK